MTGQNLGLTSLGIVVTFISTVQNRYPRELMCMIDNFIPAAHNDFTLHLLLLHLPHTVTLPPPSPQFNWILLLLPHRFHNKYRPVQAQSRFKNTTVQLGILKEQAHGCVT